MEIRSYYEKLRQHLIAECDRDGFEHVAAKIGLHRNTVYGIIKGRNGNPRLKTMEVLEDLYNKERE